MFGYDDTELNDILMAKALDPSVTMLIHELDPNRFKIFAINSQLGPGSQAQSYTPVGAGIAFSW